MRELLCKLIGHRRSRRRARPVGGTWRSSCRFCGSEMVRTRPGQWRPVGHCETIDDAALKARRD